MAATYTKTLDPTLDYTYVELNGPNWPSNIIDWLNEYPLQGNYCYGGTGVYFSNEKDASVCILRWAGK